MVRGLTSFRLSGHPDGSASYIRMKERNDESWRRLLQMNVKRNLIETIKFSSLTNLLAHCPFLETNCTTTLTGDLY